MGEEKLDNTVYTIRGLFDLADMAQAKRDTRDRARGRASTRATCEPRFEAAWWYEPAAASTPTRSTIRATCRSFQKHWIGVDADGGRAHPRRQAPRPGLAALAHGTAALAGREDACYSGERPYNLGLFHTGCGGGRGRQGRAHDLRARTPRSRPSARATTAASAPAEALHRRRGRADVRRALQRRRRGPPHRRARPTSSPAPRRRSSRRRTSTRRARATRTSSAAPAAARWSCRRGTSTGRCGRSSTSSSACGRTSAAAG